MATIKVKAAPGLRFPMERRPKRHITDTPVTVESTAYYRRAIADGDLIRVTEKEPAANATGTTQKSVKATAPVVTLKDKAATDE